MLTKFWLKSRRGGCKVAERMDFPERYTDLNVRPRVGVAGNVAGNKDTEPQGEEDGVKEAPLKVKVVETPIFILLTVLFL